MPRTTHDRSLDHRGTELDTDVLLDGALAAPTSTASGQTVHQALVDTNAAFRDGGVNVVIGNGSTVVATGLVPLPAVEIPFDGTITAVRLFADQSGSIVIDIWKDTYANYPPVNADSITASAPPTISSATKSQDTTLTGWTTTVTEGDVLRFNVDSATTITQVTLALRIRRT